MQGGCNSRSPHRRLCPSSPFGPGCDFAAGVLSFMKVGDIMEMWKPIPDYQNYECSSTGQIRNITTGTIMKQSINQRGYYQVCVSIKGKRKIIFPHRCVALLFVENHENKPQVNHIDGVKTNNNASNLEWCTSKENSIHASKIGLSSGGHNKKAIRCIETGIIYESAVKAEKACNIRNSWIIAICKNKKRSAHGLHFEYA